MDEVVIEIVKPLKIPRFADILHKIVFQCDEEVNLKCVEFDSSIKIKSGQILDFKIPVAVIYEVEGVDKVVLHGYII